VLRFILRRLLATIPMVLVVVSLTWGLIRLAPGNFYSGERAIPAAIERNIREKYGLDRPWYEQYGRMLGNTIQGDFGSSLRYAGESVNTILANAAPVSALLGGLAYLLALVVGVTAGTLAALRQNSRLDYGSMAAALIGISVPNFVLGPVLVLWLALTWYWLPPALWNGFSANLVLPVLTLSAVYMAYIARLTRAGMLEVLRSNYIRTARAKGLSERTILVRHAMRGGLLPVLGTGARAPADGHRCRGAHLRRAGAGQLLHQRQPEPGRAAHHRHRRLHLDPDSDPEPAGRRRLRDCRSARPLLT
jgi:oligopeptide transport system permease protein